MEATKTAGWAVVRDKTLAGEYDAAHMLAPMPLAITLGLGATPTPYRVAAIENINGQAITLAMKHEDDRDPKKWKGFVFAVSSEYSMHNFLLRYYVAEAGLDPDKDIQLRVIPPPEMVANLSAGNIDGCLAPDPVNQRAVFGGVGFIHILSREIWDGHPCCSFAASEEFATRMPNTFGALLRAIVDATEYSAKPANRADDPDGDAHLHRHRVAGDRRRRDARRRHGHRLLRLERVEQPQPLQRDLFHLDHQSGGPGATAFFDCPWLSAAPAGASEDRPRREPWEKSPRSQSPGRGVRKASGPAKESR